MKLLDLAGLDLYFTRENLKAGLLVSLLSVWVLVGVFYYLNRYTRRNYFSIWTVAWLFYALWLTLNFTMQAAPETAGLVMLKQWCVSIAAVFLLWGSVRFLGRRARESQLGWFMVFLFVWSYIGAYHLKGFLQGEIAIFGLIGLASMMAGCGFYQYRRKRQYIAASLLGTGFFLWGCYLAGYPFLQASEDLVTTGFFVSTVLQLFIAVSMIILVLEQMRFLNQRRSLVELRAQKLMKDVLQTKMHSTEARYRELFEQASEAIVIAAQEDFRILELNRAAERLLGIDRSDTNRQSLTAFCKVNAAAETPPKTGKEWFEFIRFQRPLNLVRKNGSVTPSEVAGSPVEFDGQSAYQFFFWELTERSRLEQQLRQSEKLSALGQMISGIAHELNNPLAVIKGYLELILAHRELSDQTRADLEKVAREGSRAAKLVRNFLAFARHNPEQKEMVNLNDQIERMVELRKFDFSVANVELILELDPNLPQTHADADQIQQVLINLLNNALQAMADTTEAKILKIHSQQVDKLIQITIEDNGPGVPKELETKIFEPLFTTKEVGVGTGLGLSITHSIMAEHKGRIFYQKASIGGAGFVLEFPVITVKASEPITGTVPVLATKKPPESTPPKPAQILVLDDEKALAEMLAEILTILGHIPTVCNTASEALELLKKREFDLILSDIRMPVIDGQKFFKMATKDNLALMQRIIFLTGDVLNEDTRAFLESVGNPHIAKPFQLANIEQAIKKALGQNAPADLAQPVA